MGSLHQDNSPSKILIDSPEFILFGDKTGVNTDQQTDSNQGGKDTVLGQTQIVRYKLKCYKPLGDSFAFHF